MHLLAYLFDPEGNPTRPGTRSWCAPTGSGAGGRSPTERCPRVGCPDQLGTGAADCRQRQRWAARTSPAPWSKPAWWTVPDAFTADWLANGGRAYVGRYALDPVRAIGLVRAAGGVAVLAHPRAGRDTLVSDEQIAGLAAAGLAGLEVFHPDQSGTERAGLLALARRSRPGGHGRQRRPRQPDRSPPRLRDHGRRRLPGADISGQACQRTLIVLFTRHPAGSRHVTREV